MGGATRTARVMMGEISAQTVPASTPGGPRLKEMVWNDTGQRYRRLEIWPNVAPGNLDECQWRQIEDAIARSPAHA